MTSPTSEIVLRARRLVSRGGVDSSEFGHRRRRVRTSRLIITIIEDEDFLHIEAVDPNGDGYWDGCTWSLVYSDDPDFATLNRPYLVPRVLEDLRRLQLLDDLADI